MSNFKIVVLAANCFSGQDLVDLLLDDPNKEVIGVGRSPEKGLLFARYQYHKNISNFRYYQLDLNRDMDRISELMHHEKPDWVINFVAQGEVSRSWEQPGDWFQTNSVAVSKLVRCLCDYSGLKKYLHISTPEVYGSCSGHIKEDTPLNPSTPYAASKASGDLSLIPYHKNYNFPVVFTRATNVYGAHQQLYRIIPRTVIYIKNNKKIHLQGGGRAVKSYIHIRDVCAATLQIARYGTAGEIYHISPDGEGISIVDLVDMICAQMGRPLDDCVTMTEERLGQDAFYLINSDKLRESLGWRSQVSLEKGIAEVINWVEENFDALQSSPLDYIHQP